MKMERSHLALKIFWLVVISIGLGMIVVGFVNDADLITFFGVFLVMVPLFIRLYIERTRQQHKAPSDVSP
jgi:Flp pilus assembly protein TadB